MNGDEFRALRAAAGLSVRGAAKRLGVSPSTIQRWQMGQVVIPSDCADRMRQSAGSPSVEQARARTLGRLTAVLSWVRHGYVPQEMKTHVSAGTAKGIGELMDGLREEAPERYAAVELEIEDLFASIDEYPTFLTPEQTAEFWLGYYQRRKDSRGAEQPTGSPRSA
jgi:transcriptional regulator with XRE-family HTH domain